MRDPEAPGGAYRDLKYFYVSYAISPRLARPARLQFWAEATDGATRLALQLDALVRRRFVRLWDTLQRVFLGEVPDPDAQRTGRRKDYGGLFSMIAGALPPAARGRLSAKVIF